MNDLISVIVPIYKVEQLLSRCIESLLNQKNTNFELILVDDGSPDQCGLICDNYAQKDSRIKVVHKQNGGLSDARNAGLKIATGEYIAFVDSDDWVAPDYLSSMLEALRISESDICECEVLRTSGKVEFEHITQNDMEVYSAVEALKQLVIDGVFHQYVWNKLYKRSCIEEIYFPVGKTNEDEFWTYQVFGKAQKIVKTSKTLYYYFQREGSIMGSEYNLKRLDALEAKQQRQIYIEQQFPELSDLTKINLYESCIYSGQMTLKYLSNAEKKKAIKIIDNVQKKCRPGAKVAPSLACSQELWIQLAKINFWGLCRLKNLLRRGF